MRVLIIGGSGFIGTNFASYLKEKKHKVRIITRSQGDNITTFNYSSLSILIEISDIVINLAGADISKRWTKKYKETIYTSRIQTTKQIIETINDADHKPEFLINASAVGYYGSTLSSEELTEESAPGVDFLSNVCENWEKEIKNSTIPFAITRFGIVLSNKGGFLKRLLQFSKFFSVVPGNGKQYISWISLMDLKESIDLIMNKKAEGIFNLVTNNPITFQEFAEEFRNKYKSLFLFKIPNIVLKIVLGEGEILLTKGQKVLPVKLNELGFKFKINTIKEFFNSLSDH